MLVIPDGIVLVAEFDSEFGAFDLWGAPDLSAADIGPPLLRFVVVMRCLGGSLVTLLV